MLIPGLQAINHPQYLRRVPPRARWIAQNQTNRLLWVDDVYAPDRQRHALGVHIGRILVVDHVIQQGDFALLVANDGELKIRAGNFIDVFNPAVVRIDRVGGQADQFDIALGEFRLEFGEGAEFCGKVGWSFASFGSVFKGENVGAVLTSGADGRKVLWVGEDDGPAVADPLVEVLDGAIGGLC